MPNMERERGGRRRGEDRGGRGKDFASGNLPGTGGDVSGKLVQFRREGGMRSTDESQASTSIKDRTRQLEDHEKKLEEIKELHGTWRDLNAKLSQSAVSLSALSKSIGEAESREKDLSLKNDKLEDILRALQEKKEPSLQEIYLRTLSPDESISSTISNIRKRVNKDRKEINIHEGKIVNLEKEYDKRYRVMLGFNKIKKEDITKLLEKLHIEIRGGDIDNYLAENDQIVIKSVNDLIAALKMINQQSDYVIFSGKADEDGNEKRDRAWKELQSTTFYRERVAPFADKMSAEYQIEALNTVIPLASNPEVTKASIEAHSAKLKELQGIFDNNLRKLYPDEQDTVASGYSAASNLYQALREQDTQALKALDMKDTLQKKKSRQPTEQQAPEEQGLQWLNTAIESLNVSEEQQQASYRGFIKQCLEFNERSSQKSQLIPGYSETSLLYKAIRKSGGACKEAEKQLSGLQESVALYGKGKNPEVGSVRHQNDDAEFGTKLKAFIEACLYRAKKLQEHVSYMKAVCDFYKSIAVTPLEEEISKNQASISSIREEIDGHSIIIKDEDRKIRAIEDKIKEITKDISEYIKRNNPEGDLRNQEMSLAESDTDQWFAKQRKQHEQAIQRLTFQESSAQSDSIPTVLDIARQRGASNQNLDWLKIPEVANYTEELLKKYYDRYEKTIDINQAVKSAKFLADQKFVGEPREHIEITADLAEKFGVDLSSLRINVETLEITIVNESGTKSSGSQITEGPIIAEPEEDEGKSTVQSKRKGKKRRGGATSRSSTATLVGSGSLRSDSGATLVAEQQQENLVPLKFDRYGGLRVEGRKIKGSIIASREGDPHTLILSIRSPELSFAPNTVMQQSGSVDFKDLATLLEEDVNITTLRKGVDILPRAITREFKEEAPGYEITSGAIQRVEDKYGSKTDHVVFFRAEATKTDNIVKNDNNSFRETIGTFELNIPNLIEDHGINITHFWNDEGRLTVKQAILKEAVQKRAINEVPERGNPQWVNYCKQSYNVDSLVQRIREVVRQKPAFSWRLRES